MEEFPPSRLAELPATQWQQAKERVAVVRRYISDGDYSYAAASRHAAELGLKRGMFARLVRSVRAWDESSEGVRLRPRRAPSDAAQAAVAREAVARLGPAAKLQMATKAAAALADERGIARPGERALRLAHGSVRAGTGIRKRLGLTGDLTLDACAMAVRLRETGDVPAIAVLSAVVDSRLGTFAGWRVTAGLPNGGDLKGLVAECLSGRSGCRLSVPSGILGEQRAMLQEDGVELTDDRIAMGSVIMAAVGARLGRITLLPRLLARGGGGELPVVDLRDLSDVVAELLAATGLANEPGR